MEPSFPANTRFPCSLGVSIHAVEVFGLEPNLEWIQSVFPLTAILVCCIFGCANDQNWFPSQLGIFQARKRGILDMDIMYKKSVEQLKIVLTSPVQGLE